MKKYGLFLAAVFVMAFGARLTLAQTMIYKSVIERLDPAVDMIASPDAQLTVMANGFGYTEGLTWIQEGAIGHLYFSDIPANLIYKMSSNGTTSVAVEESGYRGPWDGYAMI